MARKITLTQKPKGSIAFFLPALTAGGAEHNILTLARRFAAEGHRTDLVIGRAEGPLMEQVPEGVNLVVLDVAWRPLRVSRLARYLRAAKPDTLLSAMALTNCIAVLAHRLAGSSARLVLSERSTLSSEVKASWVRLPLPWLMRRLYRHADRVIAVSAGVADDLSEMIGMDRSQILVTYNPVITAEMKEMAKETLEHPWFGSGEPPVILAVGRLGEQKDFSTLVRAFAQVRATRTCRLLILGEGSLRPALEAEVAALGLTEDVALPGFVTNPYPYMRAAEVFVLSSRWEGLPTVLIEAAALGTKVVATDCPSGSAEILAGEAAEQLVPVGDEAAMAKAILAALDRDEPLPCDLERFTEDAAMDTYRKAVFVA